MSKEHVQSIADKLALFIYGIDFSKLPKFKQVKLFNKAYSLADKEVRILTDS
ncbi:MAG: hypothetical protein PHS93_09300 [Candidatus Omnitrophica bacterium]|nr:hypothetical protein [Candidatus Omnitrophota bacterium]